MQFLTMIPFLFTSMTYATLHEDMQQVKLGGRGLYSLSSLHFSTTIIPFFISFTVYEDFFSNIYFPTILCCTLLHKHWYTYWHDSHIYKNQKRGFLILSDVFLMHIDSIHFPVKIWANYYHNNKRTVTKWMLLTQEPTFFIFMVVTQEPTIRKKCQLLLM